MSPEICFFMFSISWKTDTSGLVLFPTVWNIASKRRTVTAFLDSVRQECDHRRLQKRPRCAATCPCASVCSSSSSQWHPPLRSSPLTPRSTCTWLAWQKCGPRLSPLWHFDVSSVIAVGSPPLSPWRVCHEKQAGLSGLSHGRWPETKTIGPITAGYYYRGVGHQETTFPPKLQTHFKVCWLNYSNLVIDSSDIWQLKHISPKLMCLNKMIQHL